MMTETETRATPRGRPLGRRERTRINIPSKVCCGRGSHGLEKCAEAARVTR